MRAAQIVFISFALGAAASAFGAPDGVSSVCRSGCNGELTGCVEAARADRIDCRLACRSDAASDDVGACLRDCRQAARDERHACRGAGTTCGAGCSEAIASAANPSCRGECGIALGECARAAAGDRQGCLASCGTGPERHACVEECIAATSGGIDECHAEFAECRAGCDGVTPTSTTSTSSTATTATSTSTSTTSPTATSTSSSTSTTAVSTTTSTTLGPFCGDGVVNQASEECDGDDLDGAVCPGSPMGAFPLCRGDCTLDFSPCDGGTTTTTLATTTSTSTTVATSSTTTSTTLATTTSTVGTTTSSTTSTVVTTTSTTTSTLGTTTTTSSTTSTTMQTAAVMEFITGAAGGTCGETRQGGASGTILKTLTCGGLNVGGGCFEDGGSCGVAEGPTPSGSSTQLNATCSGSSCAISARTSAETGSNLNCSAVGCQFGAWLSIANGGTSTCVLNTFASPAGGNLDLATGAFDGSFPLTSAVTLTGNGAEPCPPCTGGVCNAAAANPGAPCMALNASGDSYECIPAGFALTPFGVDLTPISTGTEFMDTTTDEDQVPGGIDGEFCPGQDAIEPGTIGCFDSGSAAVCDYIEERGSHATGVAVDGGPVASTLASVFCIPAAGNGLIDGAADLPGPGATSLPGTVELFTLP